MIKTAALLVVLALVAAACESGAGSNTADNAVASTVNGKKIMLAEVERVVSQRAGGREAQLSQLELAQARLQVLDGLIQREVLFQKAEKEKLLPTDEQIASAINQQKQQSGMTDEDFEKSLQEQKLTREVLREEARKDLAIRNLQDKYTGKISISDREVEDFYNKNQQRFVSARGVALAMIAVDPADNSAQGISQNDAKNDAEAKLKIDNIYQRLRAGADFATVARSTSEDANSVLQGGDIGFATEEDLKQNGFPQELINRFFGSMEVGSFTEPIRFNSGRWYIFKLAEKRLQTENLTLESPGVRQQITQALVKQQSDILNAALLEVAMYEAKIVNNLAANMISNPSNLGLRPASTGAAAAGPSPQQTTTPTQEASPVAPGSPAAVEK
ncbi:MAG TPA: SurA N-terminal domain-containing protein [Pyrinomonadaceae bacterium]|nr:SurA N-terminal domain-containing protein [Pyrinomonadaceae bacterium]